MKAAPGFIVVEGAIGVGKTTLAQRLAERLGAELLLEQAEENPFLERFYANPRSAALQTQLFFLFQRARQMQALSQSDLFQPVRVADFLMDKDRLFARVTLDDEEYRLYEQVYQHLTLNTPRPDLVVYLQAPVEVLLARIGRRGRASERGIDPDYLRRIHEAYMRYFHHYDQTPLLIVNAAEIDFANNDQDFELLLNQVCQARSGRHYFNPLSVAL